jgi:hypothetical protein
LFGSSKSGKSFIKISLYISHQFLDVISNFGTLNGLSTGDSSLSIDLVLLTSNNQSLLVSVLLLFFDSDGSNLKYFFEVSDLLLSLL